MSLKLGDFANDSHDPAIYPANNGEIRRLSSYCGCLVVY